MGGFLLRCQVFRPHSYRSPLEAVFLLPAAKLLARRLSVPTQQRLSALEFLAVCWLLRAQRLRNIIHSAHSSKLKALSSCYPLVTAACRLLGISNVKAKALTKRNKHSHTHTHTHKAATNPMQHPVLVGNITALCESTRA